MNKSSLIASMAEKSGLNRKQAEAALDAFLDSVTENLKNGEKVQIVGFGTFEIRERAEHQGINPATQEVITVKSTRSPCFKPAKSFKEEF